jgi:acetylornithine deacetylase/succinyl-diaminopimelate desuccinylase-like protein
MDNRADYIARHKQRFMDELFDLIRIPSVSSLKEHLSDMLRATEYLRQKFLEVDGNHSPNENYPVSHFCKGIETIPLFYIYFTEYSK